MKAFLIPLRMVRSLLYGTARVLGDIIAILDGKYAHRILRKKGLKLTSGWSRRL